MRWLRVIFRPWIHQCGDCSSAKGLHKVANEAMVIVRENYALKKENDQLRREVSALRLELSCYKTAELPTIVSPPGSKT